MKLRNIAFESTVLAKKTSGMVLCLAGILRARPLQETDTERRLRESQVVDEKITPIYNIEDFRRESKEVRSTHFCKNKCSNFPSEL